MVKADIVRLILDKGFSMSEEFVFVKAIPDTTMNKLKEDVCSRRY